MPAMLPESFSRRTPGAARLPQTPDTVFAGSSLDLDEVVPVLPVLRPGQRQALGYQRLIDAVARTRVGVVD